MSILYVHLLSPIQVASLPSPSESSPSCFLPRRSDIFSTLNVCRRLFQQKNKKACFPPHPVCLSHLSLRSSLLCFALLPSLSSFTLPSFGPPLFSSSSPAGYCCSLCLFLKDYLCSHSDKGFGKGSLSAPSFRRWAPCMGGEYMKEAGCVQVCVRACVCVYLSVLVVCIRTCVCVRSLECWAVIKSKRSQQCEWRLLLLTHAQMRITLTNVPPLRAPIFIFFCVVSQNCTTDVAASDNRAVGKSRGEKKRNFFGPSRP